LKREFGWIGKRFETVNADRFEAHGQPEYMRMRQNVNELGFKYLLNTPNSSILQHHLDSSRVIGAGSEDASDDAFGQSPAALIVFFNHQHTRAGLDVASFGNAHLWVLFRGGMEECVQIPIEGKHWCSISCESIVYSREISHYVRNDILNLEL
jgi:hypothetical protein